MCMFKDSTRKGRKLTLAVVAVKVSMVVALVIDFVMYAPTFRTYIPVLVLGLNDEIYGIVLGRESLEKIKLVHTPCFCLRSKGTNSLGTTMIFAISRKYLQD